MDLQSLRRKVVRERFPFLKHYVSTEADVSIQAINVALAYDQPRRWSGFAEEGGYVESRRDIFLLSEVGEKIGTVGEVSELLPTKKFCSIILRREKVVIRKIPETVQEALNRVEGGFYILVTESHTYHHDKVILHLPPDGQTAKMYLTQLLAEAHSEEELRLREVEEQRVAASQEEQRKNQEAQDTEVTRLDSLLRKINGH